MYFIYHCITLHPKPLVAMNVKLSLVGFGVNLAPLVLSDSQQNTVQTVLDAFQAASQYPFSYMAVPSPFRPGINLVFSLTYKGAELASILAKSAGQEERVWQFYVLDATGMPIPNNSGQGRTPYDQFVVQEGYTIIWRLITVIKQPIEIAKRVRNGTTPEQADARQNTYKLL